MESSWIVLALASAFLLATADAWTKRYFNAASAASLLIICIPWRTEAMSIFLIAAAMGGMAFFHFLALQVVETAYMITVKQTSLLFAMLYGAWWFQEPGLKQNLFAGVMMLAGVALVA